MDIQDLIWNINILPLFFAFTHEKNEDNNLFLEIGGGHHPIFLYILKSIGKKYKFQILEEQNFKVQIPQEYEDYLKYTYKLEDMKFKDSNFRTSQYMRLKSLEKHILNNRLNQELRWNNMSHVK